MATFLVAHGAWGAGWVWRKMHPLMTARGHRLITPTLTSNCAGVSCGLNSGSKLRPEGAVSVDRWPFCILSLTMTVRLRIGAIN